MNNKKFTSGETLIEVLLAVSVIMIALAPASGLQVQSTRNLAFNRDHLIAETLANEGIEIIRNMRDTNFLKFSAKAKECWNTKPDYDEVETCEKDINKIKPGSYILKRDIDTLKWSIEKLSIENISADSIPDEYHLKLDASTQLYNHNSGDPTNFFREIYIEYDGDEKMNVLSRVFFKNGIKTAIVKRSYYLTNQTE
ncbi:hypothetical protein HZC21_00805 [Candidatus Peregrinibacteria bacterium]|nr:hypothetical protein [Candidatus Peregrinibacteria bacterium]